MSEPMKHNDMTDRPEPNQEKKNLSHKLPYATPVVRFHGLLRDITLGSTGGVNESGGNGAGWHWEG